MQPCCDRLNRSLLQSMLDQLSTRDTLAERSKAVAQGAIPKGRGFEPHRCHFDEVARQAIAACDEVEHVSIEAAVHVFLELAG